MFLKGGSVIKSRGDTSTIPSEEDKTSSVSVHWNITRFLGDGMVLTVFFSKSKIEGKARANLVNKSLGYTRLFVDCPCH